MSILRHLAVVLGLLAALEAHALPDDREQPIRISADTVTVDQKTGVTRYQGDVVMLQGGLRIAADRVVVRYQQGEIQSLSAFGNPVTLRQRAQDGVPEMKASAARLQYSAADRVLHLYDQVALQQGDDVLHSAALHYDLGTNRLQAEGDPQNRVYSVIQPGKPAASERP